MWPSVARRLTRLLLTRGTDPQSVDDIVQEVATRALTRQVAYESADDLAGWAWTVARNLAVDNQRASRRLAAEPVPDRPAAGDVFTVVESRMRLQAVRTGMQSLRDSDREAIVAAVNGAMPERHETARVGMQRLRARTRLLQLVAGVVGALVAFFAAVRLLRPRRLAPLALAMPVAIVALVSLDVLRHPPAPMPVSLGNGGVQGAIQLTEHVAARTPPPQADAPAAGTTSTREDARAVARRRVVAEVAHRAPTGHPTAVGIRDGDAHDAVLCVERKDTGRVCVLEGAPVLPLPPLP